MDKKVKNSQVMVEETVHRILEERDRTRTRDMERGAANGNGNQARSGVEEAKHA